mgnify:CR=1 FL=1
MNSNGQPRKEEKPIHLPPPEKTGGSVVDKVVLIIGGAGENGRTLATALAEQGAHIALVYSSQAQHEALDTKHQVEAHDRECLLIPVTPGSNTREFARRVVQRVVDALGRLDVFIDYSSSPAAAARNDRANNDLFPGVGMLVAAMNQMTKQT